MFTAKPMIFPKLSRNLDRKTRSREFQPQLGHMNLSEIHHEIISVAIISLIQEEQLSVTDENTCTNTG